MLVISGIVWLRKIALTLTRGDSSSSAGDGNGATTAAYNVAALLPGVGTEGAGPWRQGFCEGRW